MRTRKSGSGLENNLELRDLTKMSSTEDQIETMVIQVLCLQVSQVISQDHDELEPGHYNALCLYILYSLNSQIYRVAG